jgi:hypothetical protein
VQRLQIRLIGGLRDYELHRWPLHRFGDRLCITEVILLAPGIGPHVPRRHQPSVVAKRLKSTTEMMPPTQASKPIRQDGILANRGLDLVT